MTLRAQSRASKGRLCAVFVVACAGCRGTSAGVDDPIAPAPRALVSLSDATSASVVRPGGPPTPLPASPAFRAPASDASSVAGGVARIVVDVESITAAFESVGGEPDGPRVAKILRDLGFTSAEVGALGSTSALTLERSTVNLDADADLEETLLVRANPSPTSPAVEVFLVVLDPSPSAASAERSGEPLEGATVVGTRHWTLAACSVQPTISLRAEPVHAPTLQDLVVEWEAIAPCDGHAGTTGLEVLTTSRGRLEVLASVRDDFSFAPHSGREMDPRRTFVFDGRPPRGLRILEGDREVQRLDFDRAKRVYR